MSRQLEQELTDIAVWWKHNRKDLTDIDKKLDFLIKANDHLLWVLAKAAEDIQYLEGRAFNRTNERRRIFIPDDVYLHGEIRTKGS